MLRPSRADADCALVALAHLTGQSYEDVYVAMRVIDRKYGGKEGMYNREVVKVAARLGVRLTPTRTYDLDDDEGVLRIRWNDKKKKVEYPGGHFVAIRHGIALDNGAVTTVPMPWREYLELAKARACSLLKVEEGQ
jgi:hypothetical protein